MTTISVLVIFCLICAASATVKLQELYSWNVLDWNYPDEYSRLVALQTGGLIPENALPVGIERWRNKLFISVPRWKGGIPATLNYIPLDASYEPSPKLIPYPSFEGNELGNCDTGLNTVYRIKADKCDRLWVLDVGTYGYDPNVTNLCPYTLNVYDLNTDQRIRKYVFRPEDIVPTTFIANIALDMGNGCDDTFAYFSDELGYGLIAYSWQQNKSWRFSHNFFMPDPLQGDYNIGGLNFQWGAEGIFGISASPIGADGFRTLYFSPLSSSTEFAVSTRVLRDENKVTDSYKDFKVVGNRGPDGHSTAKVFDDSGVQLYNLVDQNGIGCWSSSLSYKPQNMAIIDKDDNGLIFPSDVKIDDDKNVWVISDRMPVFLESTLDYSDINFRIFAAPLQTLLQGTVCETQNQIQLPANPLPLPNFNNQLYPLLSKNVINSNTLASSKLSNTRPNQFQYSPQFYSQNIPNTITKVSSNVNFPNPSTAVPYIANKISSRNFPSPSAGISYLENKGTKFYTHHVIGTPSPANLRVDFPQVSSPLPFNPSVNTENSIQNRPWWLNQQYSVTEETL